MDANKTELLLVRHGQSTWNEQGRWQGQADPPLSEFGEQQAAAAAMKVGQVDLVMSSPQLRAFGTASIISESIGIGPVVTHDDLRERSVGPWSGLTHQEIHDQYPGWIDSDRRPDGWEYDIAVEARVVKALGEIHAQYGGGTVLVVAHGGVIINVEKHLGVSEARVPNLHGRVVVANGSGLVAGERLSLLPDEMRTGGRSNRA